MADRPKAGLPRAILFDMDDTLIRAYAPAGGGVDPALHVFSAHLDAHDEAALTRVRLWPSWKRRAPSGTIAPRPPNGASTFPAPAALGPARAREARSRGRRNWPTASPIPSPNSGARIPASIPTPMPRSTRCATPVSGWPSSPTGPPRPARQDRAFELAHRFHHIQIEGEFGQGKPNWRSIAMR